LTVWYIGYVASKYHSLQHLCKLFTINTRAIDHSVFDRAHVRNGTENCERENCALTFMRSVGIAITTHDIPAERNPCDSTIPSVRTAAGSPVAITRSDTLQDLSRDHHRINPVDYEHTRTHTLAKERRTHRKIKSNCGTAATCCEFEARECRHFQITSTSLPRRFDLSVLPKPGPTSAANFTLRENPRRANVPNVFGSNVLTHCDFRSFYSNRADHLGQSASSSRGRGWLLAQPSVKGIKRRDDCTSSTERMCVEWGTRRAPVARPNVPEDRREQPKSLRSVPGARAWTASAWCIFFINSCVILRRTCARARVCLSFAFLICKKSAVMKCTTMMEKLVANGEISIVGLIVD